MTGADRCCDGCFSFDSSCLTAVCCSSASKSRRSDGAMRCAEGTSVAAGAAWRSVCAGPVAEATTGALSRMRSSCSCDRRSARLKCANMRSSKGTSCGSSAGKAAGEGAGADTGAGATRAIERADAVEADEAGERVVLRLGAKRTVRAGSRTGSSSCARVCAAACCCSSMRSTSRRDCSSCCLTEWGLSSSG